MTPHMIPLLEIDVGAVACDAGMLLCRRNSAHLRSIALCGSSRDKTLLECTKSLLQKVTLVGTICSDHHSLVVCTQGCDTRSCAVGVGRVVGLALPPDLDTQSRSLATFKARGLPQLLHKLPRSLLSLEERVAAAKRFDFGVPELAMLGDSCQLTSWQRDANDVAGKAIENMFQWKDTVIAAEGWFMGGALNSKWCVMCERSTCWCAVRGLMSYPYPCRAVPCHAIALLGIWHIHRACKVWIAIVVKLPNWCGGLLRRRHRHRARPKSASWNRRAQTTTFESWTLNVTLPSFRSASIAILLCPPKASWCSPTRSMDAVS